MIPNPWIIVAVLVAWIASLWAVGLWQNDAGRTSERVSWQAKDNKELVAANKEIQRLNDAARAKEHEQAAQLAAIGAAHAKELEDLDAQRRRDVADAHSGARKLRVPGGCKPTGGSPAAEGPAAPARSDDATTAELPRQITADLLELADDADRNTRQLGKCQAVVETYQ